MRLPGFVSYEVQITFYRLLPKLFILGLNCGPWELWEAHKTSFSVTAEAHKRSLILSWTWKQPQIQGDFGNVHILCSLSFNDCFSHSPELRITSGVNITFRVRIMELFDWCSRCVEGHCHVCQLWHSLDYCVSSESPFVMMNTVWMNDGAV